MNDHDDGEWADDDDYAWLQWQQSLMEKIALAIDPPGEPGPEQAFICVDSLLRAASCVFLGSRGCVPGKDWVQDMAKAGAMGMKLWLDAKYARIAERN